METTEGICFKMLFVFRPYYLHDANGYHLVLMQTKSPNRNSRHASQLNHGFFRGRAYNSLFLKYLQMIQKDMHMFLLTAQT